MHVHASYDGHMRTTLEIPDEQRARLLEIAGARGEKGYSHLVQEAIELLLEQLRRKEGKVQAALAQKGVLSEKEADDLERRTQQTRCDWR